MNFNHQIQILDCTLRDGGYVNNWEFGKANIIKVIQKLDNAFIDIIEAGFLSSKKNYNINSSVFNSIRNAELVLNSRKNNVALMINCGDCNIDSIPEYSGGAVNILRIAFHKPQKANAQQQAMLLKQKGYKVFFQPMFTSGYSDMELLELISWTNSNRLDALYIVDSFGTMRKNDVLRLTYLIDNNLNKDIAIGFHSHNNLQLSFSNAQELTNLKLNRHIIIDSSVLGMGRGAGNLCTELILQHLNENYNCDYNIAPIMEIMDETIFPIFSQHRWGYSVPYYIAANENCHPNYATYLMNRQTLCIRDINSIIRSIPITERSLFNSELISNLYNEYQKHNIDDSAIIDELSKLCMDRKILILAPGKTLSSYQKQILEFIDKNNPVIFSINHIPEKYRADRIFISNAKRFNAIDWVHQKIDKSKLICTSNIPTEKATLVNYSSLLNDDDIISDNSCLMLINLLRIAKVNCVTLAGFDGFNYHSKNNYYNNEMMVNVHLEKYDIINRAIIRYLSRLSNSIDIRFLTPSIYNTMSIGETI